MRPLPGWTRTDGLTASEALRRAAAAHPDRDRDAVDRGERLTYAAWDRRSDGVAAGLLGALEPGGRVALVFDGARWTEYAVASLAAHKAAAVAVPVVAGLGDLEVARILRDCQAAAVVAPPDLAPGGTSVPILDLGELEREAPGPPPVGGGAASGLAEILYPSRPLSPPAPVPVSHADLLSGPPLGALLHAFPPGSRAAQAALWGCLDAEDASVVLPAFDAERLCALIAAAPERACGLHPASAQALLDSGATARHDVSGLRRLVLASGGVAPALRMRLTATFPRAALLLTDGPGVGVAPHHDRARPDATGRPADETAGKTAEQGGPDPAPAAAVVETVAAVWARVLRREDIAPDADFFALGGDAPAMVASLELLADAFEVRVASSAFLDAPTVEGVAAAVARLCPVDGAPAPVAFSQEGMLWHELFAPGCQNLPGLARRYTGPLDVAALGRALGEIARRHGALRTGFELRDGRVMQVVRPHRAVDLPVRDLSDLPAAEREQAVARTVADAGRRPFDLVADPLFAPTLLRLGEEEHVLVIRTHHSVFDDWSVGVFRRQLAGLYAAYAAGVPSPLPEPVLQFTDFARRQRADLAGPAGARELAFWRVELAGAPLTTQLPVDDPDAPAGSPQTGGETVELALDPDLHDRLRALARRERATVFMTLLTAFGVLVHRYTGQEDQVLATVVANRNRTELEGLIGCFTKKVPVRLRLDGDPTFGEALARTRSALLGALSHQDLPFEAVVQDVLGVPAAAHGLVPHLALMFQGVTPRHELVLEGVESAGLDTAARAGRAHFMGGDQRPAGDLPPLPWGAGLYAGTFVILSVEESEAGISCSARGAFHAPSVRGLMERFATLLADIAAGPARPISELEILDGAAAVEAEGRGRGPTEPRSAGNLTDALRAQVRRDPGSEAVREGGQVLTYAELAERADRLAERLCALGAGPGSRIGTVLEASSELIVTVLAIWKAGAAWVGLDPCDSAERRECIVRDASVEILVGDGTLDHRGPARASAGSDDAAVVFYDSGGSAVQRGVVLDHCAVLNLLAGLRDIAGGERRTGLCPRPTDDAFLRRLVALLDGSALHIPERPLSADPGEVVRLLATGAVDLVDGTPDELRALLDGGLSDGLPQGREAVLVAGTRHGVTPELWRELRSLEGVRPHVLYGPPECGFGATSAESPVRGVGRALADVAVRVLDARGRPVPVRALGELHVAGASLARGYLDDAEGPRGRFVEHGGERRFRSGQLARPLPDGSVELLGPVDGDRDLRGFRVEPARIAAALADCPGLGHVEVVLERDERGDPQLVAHAVADGAPPSLTRLRALLWSRLPGYAWPARLVVGQPGAADAPSGESILSTLWADELGLERLDPEANYWQEFSFVAALARAREAGLPVPGEDVTRNRTVAALATVLAAR